MRYSSIWLKWKLWLGAVLFIGCTATQDNPVDSSRPPAPPLQVVSPNGGETFHTADTLLVRARNNDTIAHDVELRLSLDCGDSWFTLNTGSSITVESDSMLRYEYPLPDTLVAVTPNEITRIPCIGTGCLVLIGRYDDASGEYTDVSDGVFAIVP